MIKLLKNREVQRTLLLQIIVTVVVCVAAFLVDRRAGIAAAIMAVLLILISYGSTYLRYRKISKLASAVNDLLHGDNTISLEEYSEGELGILHSEIYKMTIRLREQQHKLINDKVYLADSIADISHQIRTPLTSINLLVQLLSDPNLKEERRQQIAHELYSLLSRIDWLITTLLKISKLDAGTVQFKQERISLDALIRKACSTLLVPIELKGQELIVDTEGEFCGDVAWTCEAIGNIVKNCMEHTPESGQIQIHARDNVLYSEIVIMDNGSGIAQEDMPHIFERFYKGKNSDDKSFGVGLALARMIITSQNGTVKAENRHPKGATFSIRFYKGTV